MVNKQMFVRFMAVKSTTNELFIYVLKILKKLILAHFSKSKNMSSLEPIVGLSIPYLIQELNETQNTNK